MLSGDDQLKKLPLLRNEDIFKIVRVKDNQIKFFKFRLFENEMKYLNGNNFLKYSELGEADIIGRKCYVKYSPTDTVNIPDIMQGMVDPECCLNYTMYGSEETLCSKSSYRCSFYTKKLAITLRSRCSKQVRTKEVLAEKMKSKFANKVAD